MDWVPFRRGRGNGSMKRPIRPQTRQRIQTPGRVSGQREVNRRRICPELGLELLPPAHIRIMPGQRSKENPDPSRALAPGAAGIAAAGRDDRGVLRDSVDVAGWRNAADGLGLAGDRRGCNSAGRDHSGSTEKRVRGIHCPGKTVAVEPLRQEPPCVFAGGAGQRPRLRGRLEPAWLW